MFLSTLLKPSERLEKTSGTTIKKEMNVGTMSVLSQNIARIIKEATGVALTNLIRGENSLFKNSEREQSAERGTATTIESKNPKSILQMEFNMFSQKLLFVDNSIILKKVDNGEATIISLPTIK